MWLAQLDQLKGRLALPPDAAAAAREAPGGSGRQMRACQALHPPPHQRWRPARGLDGWTGSLRVARVQGSLQRPRPRRPPAPSAALPGRPGWWCWSPRWPGQRCATRWDLWRRAPPAAAAAAGAHWRSLPLAGLLHLRCLPSPPCSLRPQIGFAIAILVVVTDQLVDEGELPMQPLRPPPPPAAGTDAQRHHVSPPPPSLAGASQGPTCLLSAGAANTCKYSFAVFVIGVLTSLTKTFALVRGCSLCTQPQQRLDRHLWPRPPRSAAPPPTPPCWRRWAACGGWGMPSQSRARVCRAVCVLVLRSHRPRRARPLDRHCPPVLCSLCCRRACPRPPLPRRRLRHGMVCRCVPAAVPGAAGHGAQARERGRGGAGCERCRPRILFQAPQASPTRCLPCLPGACAGRAGNTCPCQRRPWM